MRAATLAVAFSMGGHAVIAWTVPTAAPATGLGASAWDDKVELWFFDERDLVAPDVNVTPLPLVEPTPEMERPRSRASTVRTSIPRESATRATPELGALTSPAGTQSPSTEPTGSAGSATAESTGMRTVVPVAPWNVVPSAVARSDVAGSGPGLPTGADIERAMEENIDAALSEAARAPHLSTRPPPTLRPTPDGGYRWEGTGFTARIEPDGSVSFSDLPGFSFDGLGPSDGPDGFRDFVPAPDAVPPEAAVTVRFRFDLTEALERRRGNDPYYADRAWFLAQTEEVRDRLTRRHAEAQHRRRLLRLRGRLDALMQDESRPIAARHREVFSTWDDFDEDEVGRRARETLIAFVRERWPAGSAHAFTAAELQALNAGRVSRERFEPYASSRVLRVDEEPVRK